MADRIGGVVSSVRGSTPSLAPFGASAARAHALPSLAAADAPPAAPPSDGRGLLLVCVDGLSYNAMREAVAGGRMPHLAAMLASQQYVARPFMAGVPCTTPASLTGFAYGCNDTIPGYVWYDKAKDRWYDCNDYKAFHEGFEGPSAQGGGPGLFRKGSVQSSIVAGGSSDTHMCEETLSRTYMDRGRAAAVGVALRDFLMLARHPLMGARSMLKFPCEVFRELRDSVADGSVRAMPLTALVKNGLGRALENDVMTEAAVVRMQDEMKRGVPVIFADLAGYDKVSHHHGPFVDHTLDVLKGIDRRIGDLADEAHNGKHRQYEVALISDHGQTPGVEFRKKFGCPFGEWVNQTVRRIDPKEAVQEAVSGSLNHLYFASDKKQMQFSDLQGKYPELIDALTHHAGIELVVARQNGDTVILGHNGSVVVHGDRFTTSGQDPLTRRGIPSDLAAQLHHLAQMPNAGDLIVFGRWDGQSVVTFTGDGRTGGHGGLGGDQGMPMFVTEAGRAVDTRDVHNTRQMYPILRSMLPADGDPATP